MVENMKRKLIEKTLALLLPMLIMFNFLAPLVTALPPDISGDVPRSLTITKYKTEDLGQYHTHGSGFVEAQPTGTYPLEDIDFVVRRAYTLQERDKKASEEGLSEGDFTEISTGVPPVPSGYWYLDVDVLTLSAPEYQVLTTDSAGVAKKDNAVPTFAANGDDDGMYYVVESPDLLSRVLAPTDPFFVSIPMHNPSYVPGGEGNTAFEWIYDVNVYPKNAVTSITKTFSDGSADKSAKVGETLTFKVVVPIPNNITHAQTFKIEDQLDGVFDYNITNGVAVNVLNSDGEGTPAPISNLNYALSYTGGTGIAGGLLTVDFYSDSPAIDGRAALSGPAGAYEGKKLEIVFSVVVNDTAVSGQSINQATLISNLGFGEVDVTSTPATLYYNAVAIEKYDMRTSGAETVYLPGAKFQIATSEDNARAGQFMKKNPLTGAIIDYGDEPNYSNSPATTWEVTTDIDGRAIFGGLYYDIVNNAGTVYWLVETEAPSTTSTPNAAPYDYNILRNPIPVTVKGGAEESEFIIGTNTYSYIGGIENIGNNLGFELPITGGTGALILTTVGVVLMAGAIILLIIRYRKKSKDAENSTSN